MSCRSLAHIAVSLVVGSLLMSTAVLAQGFGVGTVLARADHPLLGDRLVGGSARVAIPIASTPLSLRIGVERLWGNVERTGIPCSGLVDPRHCQPEPLRDDGRLTTMAGGLGIRMLDWRGFAVGIVGDLRMGKVRADTRGLSSGNRMSASKSLWGGGIGVEGAWAPWPHLSLALEAGISASRLTPVREEVVVDGYTPFEDRIDATRLRLGVAWQPRGR